MLKFKNISFRTKLMLMLLVLSFLSGLIIIYSAYSNGKDGMTANIFNHLTSVRTAKQYEIEDYFNHMANVVEVLGKNPSIISAALEFKNAMGQIQNAPESQECKDSLSIFYNGFINKLSNNLDVNLDMDTYYPTSGAACYLQYEYIIKNPHPIGSKNDFQFAPDGSQYSKVHKEHHDYFNSLTKKFNFYDIFLVDLDNGDIVYSAFKEVDFATNLYSGPHSYSNIAELVKKISANRDLESAAVVDFANYRPSYGAPASFMGVPLRDGNVTVGALIVQLPDEQINKVMTSNYAWKEVGLGESGETYLVGEDFLMRSISRFYLEDTLNFTKELMNVGIRKEEITKMYNMGTSILNMRIKTDASEEALAGKVDTKIVDDYRGVPVLSSYAPINVAGLKWAILSEIDHAEAQKELLGFKRKIFITLALLLLVLTFLSTWIADKLVMPIEKLKAGINNMQNGEFVTIESDGNDEFSQLGRQFNDMILEMEGNQNKIKNVNLENEKLLFNFIPETIAKRIKAGEINIVDSHSSVSLILVDVIDFTDLTKVMGEQEAVVKLNELIHAFDIAAKKHHIEKIRTLGDNYYGSCGLFTPRIDHTKRIVDYAIELLHVVEQFNNRYNLTLGLVIGISSGPVTACVVGRDNFNFDLLGDTVNELFDLMELKRTNEIIVSNTIFLKTRDFYEFDPIDGEFDTNVYRMQVSKPALVN